MINSTQFARGEEFVWQFSDNKIHSERQVGIQNKRYASKSQQCDQYLKTFDVSSTLQQNAAFSRKEHAPVKISSHKAIGNLSKV